MRREFYDGIMTDLIEKKAFKLANVIYGEKQREKFTIDINDRIIGMQIYSNQFKMPEYKEIFEEILSEESEFKLTSDVCEKIAETLRIFKTDAYQRQLIEMMDQL